MEMKFGVAPCTYFKYLEDGETFAAHKIPLMEINGKKINAAKYEDQHHGEDRECRWIPVFLDHELEVKGDYILGAAQRKIFDLEEKLARLRNFTGEEIRWFCYYNQDELVKEGAMNVKKITILDEKWLLVDTGDGTGFRVNLDHVKAHDLPMVSVKIRSL